MAPTNSASIIAAILLASATTQCRAFSVPALRTAPSSRSRSRPDGRNAALLASPSPEDGSTGETTPSPSPQQRQLFDDATLAEANDALAGVGWSGAAPALNDAGELTSEDPFVQQIDASVRGEVGVGLDELLNPAKVSARVRISAANVVRARALPRFLYMREQGGYRCISDLMAQTLDEVLSVKSRLNRLFPGVSKIVVNLERDLYNLRNELATLTGATLPDEVDGAPLTTSLCDAGGGGESADALRASIAKKETSLSLERRAVFRGWLKNVFLGQALVSMALSYVMATDPARLFGSFSWFSYNNMDTSIQVLGFWWWWLFIVPSLRSRRPSGREKRALDLAFLGTPLISLLSPVVTKDTELIWLANFAVVAGAYGFAYLAEEGGGDDTQQPGWLKFLYKSLDFGSGKERGARR